MLLTNTWMKIFTHHCGTNMCQASACLQLSSQIWQFDLQNIYTMKVSWQKQACKVSLDEPLLFHQACEHRNVQVIGWENRQANDSENEEMWIWGWSTIVRRHLHLWRIPSPTDWDFTWSFALLAVECMFEVFQLQTILHRASQSWRHFPWCWKQRRCTRPHPLTELQANAGLLGHPEELPPDNGHQAWFAGHLWTRRSVVRKIPLTTTWI